MRGCTLRYTANNEQVPFSSSHQLYSFSTCAYLVMDVLHALFQGTLTQAGPIQHTWGDGQENSVLEEVTSKTPQHFSSVIQVTYRKP